MPASANLALLERRLCEIIREQKEKHESATPKIGSGAFIQMPFLSRLAQTISAKDAGLYAIERIGFYRHFSDKQYKMHLTRCMLMFLRHSAHKTRLLKING